MRRVWPKRFQSPAPATHTSEHVDRSLVRRHPFAMNTHKFLAELTADHEKDAFMLRALLWEVEKIPA